MTQFVWFWTFWHWSRESYRTGVLLRSPRQGIGGHWEDWFHYEAADTDLQAIASVGRSRPAQRQFIAWIYQHWAREAGGPRNRLVPRFVLGQLSSVAPFNTWAAFEKYRSSYTTGGISAVVLAAESSGVAEDVRRVEAVTLPAETVVKTVSEGFQANENDLEIARTAVSRLLDGNGFLRLLALWIFGGERPHAPWVKAGLRLGWLGVGGLILYLLGGPDPGEHLLRLSVTLVALWGALVLVAIVVVSREGHRAWLAGRRWRAGLAGSQVRLRMNGGLTVRGGSAGLPFALNILLSLYRAAPSTSQRAWIWHRLLRHLHREAGAWAATGVLTENGSVRPVVLEPKLRACLQEPSIRQVLTPRQPGAGPRAVEQLLRAKPSPVSARPPAPAAVGSVRLAFAAENGQLTSHPCRHLAGALLLIGGLSSHWQRGATILGWVLSGLMVLALPDLQHIVLPPPAPDAVAPSSPSPYYLWVSLDTKHPECFQVVLQSDFWSNRRAEVAPHGGPRPSMRAELLLHRLASQITSNEEDGTVWIERRQRFLTREFAPGERVGRYSVAYLTRLPHE